MNKPRNRFAAVIISITCVLAPSLAFASFDTNLSYGASGSEVFSLQQFLIQQGLLSSGAATGNFFSLTQAAVQQFQSQQGIYPISGFFGPLTRARANEITNSSGSLSATSYTNTNSSGIAALTASLQAQIQQLEAQLAALNGTNTNNNQCTSVPQPSTSCSGTWTAATISDGCTLAWQCIISTASAPSISGITAPSQLSVGQTGTWIVNVSNASGNLSYSVNWGEQSTYLYANSAASASVQSSATFTHAYSTPGTYAPTFTVTNANGQSASASATVTVSAPTVSGNFSASPTSGTSPLAVTFNGHVNSFANYTINFGDGQSITNASCPSSAPLGQFPCPLSPISHTYTQAGTYVATLIQVESCYASDGGSCTPPPPTTLASVTITVNNPISNSVLPNPGALTAAQIGSYPLCAQSVTESALPVTYTCQIGQMISGQSLDIVASINNNNSTSFYSYPNAGAQVVGETWTPQTQSFTQGQTISDVCGMKTTLSSVNYAQQTFTISITADNSGCAA